MAEITIVGNLTRDPELRFTATGRAVANFGVAENRKWKDKDDAWQEQTTFWNCQAWGELGENFAQSLPKGARVIVKGRVEAREYTVPDADGEDQKRTSWEVTVYSGGPDLNYATAAITKIERRTESSDAPGKEDPF